MRWASSLLLTSLASPLSVDPCGRIAAGEEAHKKRLAIKGFKAILDLSEEVFRDVVREDHLAVGLVGGHGGGGVLECESERLTSKPLRQIGYLTRLPTRRTRRLLVCVILKLPFVKVPRSAWCLNFFLPHRTSAAQSANRRSCVISRCSLDLEARVQVAASLDIPY